METTSMTCMCITQPTTMQPREEVIMDPIILSRLLVIRNRVIHICRMTIVPYFHLTTEKRTIESCYVNSTCYFLFVAANGNSLSPALGEGEDVILHATGYDADDNETGTVMMTFATVNKLITKWTKWDLSALGKVVTLKINMTGGTDNGYGFSLPAYYAIDDITVNLE